MKAEVVATGVPFGEGPVWCPDGTLVVTSVAEGALYRVWPSQGRAERFADTGGGANGAVLASDGGFVVTQNGGFDFAATGLFAEPPPYRPAMPGLQRVHADDSVTYLTQEPLQAPNDLAVRDDGLIVFTDPGPFPPPEPNIARVLSWSSDADVRVVADGFWYVNGIAFEPDGNIVVIERMGLLRLDPSGGGDHEWVIEDLGRGGGDGFCLDADGRFYVCSTIEHCVLVVDRDGTIVDRLTIDGDGLTTNCCFGGADGRTLFATDALPGNIVAFEHLPAAGLPMTPWPVGFD
jgi:gluconolactonase